jgi:phosphoesterase RecJ-like protein
MELLSLNGEYNVVGHGRPDGDCVGSQLAIYNALTANGIGCNIIKNDDYGRILSSFFDGYKTIDANDFDGELPLICVDCATPWRVGSNVSSKSKNFYLNIDHHISNENFAKYNFVDANASSTAQVIASALIRENVPIDLRTSEALYLGIMTDSNRFAYDSTSIETIGIVETLMCNGVDIAGMYQKVYERDSLAKYRLLERFLHNISIFENGSCCISFVTGDDFCETAAEILDSEGFVNYTRQVDGVKVGAFLELHNSYTKCSLRSKNATFRMDLLAKKFGGGGHPAAAGFTLSTRVENFYEKFKLAMAEHVRALRGN